MFKVIIGLAALALSAGVGAADEGVETLVKKLGTTFPGISADNIRQTPAAGIYEISVKTPRGMVFGHSTGDGQYFIDGDLIEVSTGRSITEERRKSARLARLEEVGEDKMIVFKAPNEKHVMTVFTDIDCGYCRKLHREMADYHAKGISVRYLFYPRSGPNTPSFAKAEAVWCAEDQQVAMTQAKNGQDVKGPACVSPIREHYDLGQEFGVRGTPALILDDGALQPGYVPAARLAQAFAAHAGSAAR